MTVSVSQIVVFVFGVAVCALSAWGIYTPERLRKLVNGVVDLDWGIYFAVFVRLLLGLVLIIAAPDSRYPLVFQGLGWVIIVAAVVIAFAGRERIRSVLAWVERFSQRVFRLWLLFGVAFGAFLIYGIL